MSCPHNGQIVGIKVSKEVFEEHLSVGTDLVKVVLEVTEVGEGDCAVFNVGQKVVKHGGSRGGQKLDTREKGGRKIRREGF